MRFSLRVVGLLLLAVASALVVCKAEGDFHDLKSNQLSWRELAKRAGYKRSAGLWRDGILGGVRNVKKEFNACTEHEDSGYCARWLLDKKMDGTQGSICECTWHTSAYCVTWECVEWTGPAYCKHVVNCSADIGAEKLTACECTNTLRNNYCSAWSCTEDRVENPTRMNSTCLEEDVSGNYCYRWNGEIIKSGAVGSSVCECTFREAGYCESWECSKREMTICDKSSRIWRPLRLAIGALTGAWCLVVAAGMTVIVYLRITKVHAHLLIYIVGYIDYFPIFMLPLFLGTPITGGTCGVCAVAWIWVLCGFDILIFLTCYERGLGMIALRRLRDLIPTSLFFFNRQNPRDGKTIPT